MGIALFCMRSRASTATDFVGSVFEGPVRDVYVASEDGTP
jgi:hypothetical protein